MIQLRWDLYTITTIYRMVRIGSRNGIFAVQIDGDNYHFSTIADIHALGPISVRAPVDKRTWVFLKDTWALYLPPSCGTSLKDPGLILLKRH